MPDPIPQEPVGQLTPLQQGAANPQIPKAPVGQLRPLTQQPPDIHQMADSVAKQYGIDPAVIRSMIQQESSWNPKATSKAGAQGLMQLMPKTGQAMGVQDAYDPRQNIEGGVKYFKQLLQKHGGDVNKALAEYNGGSRGLTNPMPETQNYIPQVEQRAGIPQAPVGKLRPMGPQQPPQQPQEQPEDFMTEAGSPEIGRQQSEMMNRMAQWGAEKGGQGGRMAYGIWAQTPTAEAGFQTHQPSPVEMAAAQGAGEVAGGTIADPRNWPFFASNAAPVALQKLISLGFAGQMGAGTIENAKFLYENWANLSPEQRANFATKTGLQAVMAGGAAYGAGEQFGGGSVEPRMSNANRQTVPSVVTPSRPAGGGEPRPQLGVEGGPTPVTRTGQTAAGSRAVGATVSGGRAETTAISPVDEGIKGTTGTVTPKPSGPAVAPETVQQIRDKIGKLMGRSPEIPSAPVGQLRPVEERRVTEGKSPTDVERRVGVVGARETPIYDDVRKEVEQKWAERESKEPYQLPGKQQGAVTPQKPVEAQPAKPATKDLIFGEKAPVEPPKSPSEASRQQLDRQMTERARAGIAEKTAARPAEAAKPEPTPAPKRPPMSREEQLALHEQHPTLFAHPDAETRPGRISGPATTEKAQPRPAPEPAAKPVQPAVEPAKEPIRTAGESVQQPAKVEAPQAAKGTTPAAHDLIMKRAKNLIAKAEKKGEKLSMGEAVRKAREQLKGQQGFVSFRGNPVTKMLADVSKKTADARKLGEGLDDLASMHLGVELSMRQLAKDVKNDPASRISTADREDAAHWLEDRTRPLNQPQTNFIASHVLPLMQDATRIYQKLNPGRPGTPNFFHRIALNKGSKVEASLMGRGGNPFAKALLSKSASSFHSRTYEGMTDPHSPNLRAVVSEENGRMFLHINNQTHDIGTRESLEGAGYRFGETTMKQIEQHTPTRYLKDVFGNTLLNWGELKKAEMAHDFLESYKQSPEFARVAKKYEGQVPPEGWDRTKLENFRGYIFEKRTAEVLDRYYDRIRGGDFSALDKATGFMRAAIFWLQPAAHVPNLTFHWGVEKGTRGWLPDNWPRIARTTLKAINTVSHPTGRDFISHLNDGAPLQSPRSTRALMNRRLAKELYRGFQSNPTALQKVGRLFGIDDPKLLLSELGQITSKGTWLLDDVMRLQATYERMERENLPFRHAVKDVSRHIPDYRLPTRILDSPKLGSLMSNPLLTMFSGYHYGMLRSFAHLTKEVFGHQTFVGDRAKSFNRIAAIGILSYLILPQLDKLAQKGTGDPKARVRRAGPTAPIESIQRVAQGKKGLWPAATAIVTPSPAAGAILNAKEAFSKPQTGEELKKSAGSFIQKSFGPTQQLARDKDASGKFDWKKFAWGQAGVYHDTTSEGKGTGVRPSRPPRPRRY